MIDQEIFERQWHNTVHSVAGWWMRKYRQPCDIPCESAGTHKGIACNSRLLFSWSGGSREDEPTFPLRRASLSYCQGQGKGRQRDCLMVYFDLSCFFSVSLSCPRMRFSQKIFSRNVYVCRTSNYRRVAVNNWWCAYRLSVMCAGRFLPITTSRFLM